ncbi:MAG: molybdopterin-dependent oxidoreductase [Firmicutes bacterium]|nr:molybdopterin-dependent oxidoreductase [Bacillota bacterium]
MNADSKPGDVTRRDALAAGGVLLGTGALLGMQGRLLAQGSSPAAQTANGAGVYTLADPENILYTTCLQCNTQCTMKAKLQNSVLVKIDGNPYSPMNLFPQLAYGTDPNKIARVDAPVCTKGQSGVQTLYDPYRLRKVLKRKGPRGSGKWESISFDRAVKEIVDGGPLFSHLGEHRNIEGFRDVFALRDAKLAKAISADVQAIRSGKMTVATFKQKHSSHLHLLIDPDHPDLGPKNNQFVLQGGRIAPDREVISKRFTFGTFGSVNWFGHTSICEQAHHVAFMYSTADWVAGKDGKYAWKKGPNQLKPDYTQAEFVIFWGTGYNEANFGPTPMSPRISQALVDGKLKIAVVDPRLSKTAAKGWWIPVIPGGDLALAMGMIRWIVENGRYDAAFLRNANEAAARQGGEKSWSNASWLVEPRTGKFLRASALGIGSENEFVVLANGHPVAVDSNDKMQPVVGDLDVAATIGGVAVKSAFRVLKEAAFEHELAFYSGESGVPVTEIAELAREFTAHGKKAGIDFYRGPIKLTYGYYAAQAIIALNFLIGNVDHKGGFVVGGGSWDGMGSKKGQPYDLAKLHPKALTPFGVKLTREASGPYETSTLFARDGYPAKRPWFPFTDDVYQEIIPAAHAGYPYPVKILWLHYGTPALSAPAGHLQIKMLQDVERVPLFIATDIVIGETSMYADYIFPDLSYPERWGNNIGTSPVVLSTISKFRQPVVAPVPETVTVGGEEMAPSMDTLMLAIAKRLGASGFGKNAFGPGMDLNRLEDFYLKIVADLAAGNKPGDAVPEATNAELELFRRARRHLPAAVFDEKKWKRAVRAEDWRRVVYVLNRGGRFNPASDSYDGAFAKHVLAGLTNLYVEPVGSGIQSVTAKRFSGVPYYQRLESMDGKPVEFAAQYDLRLFTYKEIFGGHSRTGANYAGQMALMPENFVYLNRIDASRLGLKDGNVVRLEAPGAGGVIQVTPGGATARVEGKVKVIEGVRPGAVMVSWHYGHWAYGARDVEIDGEVIPGEPVRGKGLVPNPVMAVDGYLKDVSLTDPIAGDSAFTGSRIRLVKVAGGEASGMPQIGYLSEGPKVALHQADDAAFAVWLREESLRVARGESDPAALRMAVTKHSGV